MNTLVLRSAWGVRTVAAPALWARLRDPLVLIGATSVWIATAGNLALWRELLALQTAQGASPWLLIGGFATAIAALMAVLFTALSWRPLLKPVLVTALMVSAAASHFMLSLHIVIDVPMVVNVMQTDVHEAGDLLCWRLIAHVLLLGVLPAVVVVRTPLRRSGGWRGLRRGAVFAAAAVAVLVLAVVVSFRPLASTMRNHRHVRYLVAPLNVAYASARAMSTVAPRGEPTPVGRDAQAAPVVDGLPPPLLVVVLGETGRAGNFGINGYPRDTTPRLAARGVLSFTEVWSCGTSTAASLPCMFSHRGRDAYVRDEPHEEGLLDVLQHAGLAVLWVDNQGGCKGVCDRVPHAMADGAASPALCRDGECLDGVLLDGLDERIVALPAERRARGVVVVLHQIGSHGPAYHRRSPADAKRFLPECASNDLQDCSRDEIVNAYDNSISYTDRMLGDTVDWLGARRSRWRTAMLYVADHGESLGENNLYLHGLPYAMAPDVQKRVPWVTWLSPDFAAPASIDTACLRRHAGERRTHDGYFHSVLGLMGVRTSVYDPALDAYAACRTR